MCQERTRQCEHERERQTAWSQQREEWLDAGCKCHHGVDCTDRLMSPCISLLPRKVLVFSPLRTTRSKSGWPNHVRVRQLAGCLLIHCCLLSDVLMCVYNVSKGVQTDRVLASSATARALGWQ